MQKHIDAEITNERYQPKVKSGLQSYTGLDQHNADAGEPQRRRVKHREIEARVFGNPMVIAMAATPMTTAQTLSHRGRARHFQIAAPITTRPRPEKTCPKRSRQQTYSVSISRASDQRLSILQRLVAVHERAPRAEGVKNADFLLPCTAGLTGIRVTSARANVTFGPLWGLRGIGRGV